MKLKPQEAYLLFYVVLTIMLIVCFFFFLNIKKTASGLKKRADLREAIITQMSSARAEQFQALREHYSNLHTEITRFTRFPAFFFLFIIFLLLGLGFVAINVMHLYEPTSKQYQKMRFDLIITTFTIFIFVASYFQIRSHFISYRTGGFFLYLGPILAVLNVVAFFLKNLYKSFSGRSYYI